MGAVQVWGWWRAGARRRCPAGWPESAFVAADLEDAAQTRMAIERIWQSDSAFSRDLRAGWPLYFGPIAILCGPAIILPALAKIKQERIPFIQAFGPLLLGSIILLAGFYFLTVGIRRKWAKTA